MDWDRIWIELGGLAWEIVKPLLVVLVPALLIQAARRLGLSVSAERQAQLEHDVENAIRRGEELRAAGKLTAHTDLLAWVIDEVRIARPKVSIEQVEDLVHALLPKLGLGATVKARPPVSVG